MKFELFMELTFGNGADKIVTVLIHFAYKQWNISKYTL